jgi:HEAT repeat protein/tetratricopeptide repeat protein/cytochrome c554/c'-like protein
MGRMSWVRAVLGVSTLAFVAAALHAQAPPAPPRTTYLGSAACQRCHQSSYDTWRRTLHVQMTKPIAEARVEGDFGTAAAPATASQNGRNYSMEVRGGKYFVSIARSSRPAEKFEVQYTLGARRFQGYLSKLADGRIYVLPIFWHNEAKRWVDWKEITPIPDDPDHDLRQIWNVTCVNCHATNLVKNFNPATNSYATTWTEMGIGCEACHGPGSAHVAVTTEWEKNPGSKPADPSPADLQIFSPERATPRQVFDTCGYCHGNKNNVFFGFRPGDRYADYALPFLISQPIPENDPQGDFWPDGRPSRFNRPQALAMSGCFQKGNASCINCHRMHGSQNSHSLKLQVEAPDGGLTVQSDTLCTQCHKSPSHTHHAADSQGSRCIACHMSEVNWRLITRRRDHTFQPPVPELTSRFGVPDACTTCHEDKPPEWAADVMNTWYGNADRRKAVVDVAGVMYRAGAGDPTALPDVARLAVSRSQAPLIRASAAEFAGQLIARSGGERASVRAGGGAPAPLENSPSAQDASVTPTVMNALIGAAADPDPMVRITAVRALGLITDPRVPSVLSAHLSDEARLVRVSAAEALTTQGVTQLPGSAGIAFARALDEWADSLRSFNDVAADHTMLGWLEAQRGRRDEAENELRIAIALDPADARPHVYLGVIAAREGRFADALRHFKTAKAISPGYQNLDRLMFEASKRVTKGH